MSASGEADHDDIRARIAELRAQRVDLLAAVQAARLLRGRHHDWAGFLMGLAIFPGIALALCVAFFIGGSGR